MVLISGTKPLTWRSPNYNINFLWYIGGNALSYFSNVSANNSIGRNLWMIVCVSFYT